MKRWNYPLLGSVAALFLVFGGLTARGEDPSDQPSLAALTTQLKSSIAGVWRAESATITSSAGKRRTLAAQDKERPFSATISDKNFTMRIGDKVLADMTYRLDTTQTPWTIELQSAAGTMLGICRRNGTMLKVSLNDEAKGRPADFNTQTNGMVLVLKQFSPGALFTINADGTDLQRLLTMSDYTNVGSPDWSHDGAKIACDTWRSLYGENFESVRMLVVNTDGTGLKHLGSGAMPSWSPDDKQITFSASGVGVCVMDADGSNRRVVAADGWGSQWSPARNEIAFSAYDGGSANLYIYDVATGKRRGLLEKAYRQIFWGVSWSPDGNWICFKGILPEGAPELAAVSTEGEEKGFKVILPDAMPDAADYNCTVACGGDGHQVLVSLKKKGAKQFRLYLLDFTGQEPPRLFPGYPEDFDDSNVAWSPEQKKVVFSARAPILPEPEE